MAEGAVADREPRRHPPRRSRSFRTRRSRGLTAAELITHDASDQRAGPPDRRRPGHHLRAPARVHTIFARLRVYIVSRAADPRLRPIAVPLIDDEGERVGELWCRCASDWLFVEHLVVIEGRRGPAWADR